MGLAPLRLNEAAFRVGVGVVALCRVTKTGMRLGLETLSLYRKHIPQWGINNSIPLPLFFIPIHTVYELATYFAGGEVSNYETVWFWLRARSAFRTRN